MCGQKDGGLQLNTTTVRTWNDFIGANWGGATIMSTKTRENFKFDKTSFNG